MRVELGAALAVLLALGACGKSGNDNDGKAAQKQAEAVPAAGGSGAAARAREARFKVNPGEWEVSVDTAISGADLPPEVAKMMKGMKVATRSCVTPEQASRPDVFSGKKNGNCTYRDFDLSGSQLRASIQCTDANGETTEVVTEGMVASDSFYMSSKVRAGGNGHVVDAENHIVGRRLGPCTGSSS